MAHLKNLKEHIIHLVDDADEDTMVRIVKVLEAKAATPRAHIVDDRNENPLAIKAPSRGHSPSTTPRGGAYRGIGDDDDDDGAGSRRNTEIEDDEDTGAEDRLASSRNQTKRRIGVSAAPMPAMSETFVPRVIEKPKELFDTISGIVAGCHLFASMEDREREVIVNALERDEFTAGSEVLRQGNVPVPAKFYLLFEGTCDVIKNGKCVASLSVGATFGELEIMYNDKCAATIKTVTPCVLYSLDQLSYRNIVYKVSMEKQKKYRALVEKVSFLEAMPDYERNTLAEALVTANYFDGDHIINFGEKGNFMHIIVEGDVQVVGRDRGKKVDVVRLGPGNVVGELEFLFDHLTIADVVAATKKVQTAKISRKHFEMCVGPISDELKQFVAKKGNYTHYLKEADDKVKMEIEHIGKRAKKVVGTEFTMDRLEEGGEVIIAETSDEGAGEGGRKKLLPFRFPLKPLQSSSLLLVGMREDATIVYWSEAMQRATNFPASEVIGQSLYTFMLSGKEQETLHSAITRANKFSGHVDEAYYASCESQTYTIQRRDGLTKVKMQLQIVPPLASHGKNVAEILLAVGTEVKVQAPQTHNDYSHWMVDQVRAAINSHEIQGDEKLSQINGLLTKFESLNKGSSAAALENLTVVNIRQLIGQVVMNYTAQCVEHQNSVNQIFDEFIIDEVYCDATLLPECLRFAMSNCAKHLTGAEIKIFVNIVEEYGVDVLQISFHDNGPGFPKKILESFNGTGPEIPNLSLSKVRAAIERQGGDMTLASQPGDSRLTFTLPFIPHSPDEGEAELSKSASMASGVLKKQNNFTTLVVEDRPVYRNQLCAVLWERKHAVLPGNTWEDIERMKDLTDILLIDTSQSALSDRTLKEDPITLLREKARTIAIILTSESMDPATKEAAQQAGFLTLQKPCTQIQAVQVLRKAEDLICKIKAEREKINATRAAFSANNRGEWKKGALLGTGAFGEVYEAIDTLTGGKMAVKLLKVPSKDPQVRKDIINEIEVMCGLQHPNIIHYFFAEDDATNDTIKVLMEFAAGGTLQGLLSKQGELSHQQYVSLLRDVVEGVAYIHSQHYVHRDLKTPNVLLNFEGKGKLGDFGTAKLLKDGEELYEMVGTLNYMAPEVLSAGEIISDDAEVMENLRPGEELDESKGRKLGYSFPADIWSLGCVALEMATNKPPLSHLGTMNSLATITQTVTSFRDVPDLSPLFDKDPTIIEFVSACLHPDPKKRSTAQQLLSFNIFQEAGSEETKTAMKALKRAQLMAVLNAFVAFQDPEELEAKRKEEEERKANIPSPFQRGKMEDDFFADSDDEDDSDDDGSGDGSGGDDDDDDGDDSDDGKKKGGVSVPLIDVKPQVTSSGTVSPRTGQFCAGAAASGGAGGGNGGGNGSNSNNASTTNPPPARRHFGFGVTESKLDSPRVPSAPSIPAPPKFVAGKLSSPATASPSAQSLASGGAAGGGPGGHDQLVIMLHDALLMLVDQIRKSNSKVQTSDALKAQYEEVNRQKTSVVSNEDDTDSPAASGVGVMFRPDISRLLEADAAFIKGVALAISGEDTGKKP